MIVGGKHLYLTHVDSQEGGHYRQSFTWHVLPGIAVIRGHPFKTPIRMGRESDSGGRMRTGERG